MTDLTVANTIGAQLGGFGRLKAMVGARDFCGSADALSFRWTARAKNGANCVRIRLDPSDTYTVEFVSARRSMKHGFSRVLKGSFSDIYADSLVSLFERETGLYLSL